MKNKIIFGSIASIIIIFLAGFTSAIGTNVNDEKIESPLFNTRLRKISDGNNKMNNKYNYIRKGKLIDNLPIIQKKLRYIFGIDINSKEKVRLINEIKNNPEILKNLYEQKIDIDLFTKFFDISIKNLKSKPPTDGGVTCFPTSCGDTCQDVYECECGKTALALFIMGLIIGFGVTCFFFPILGLLTVFEESCITHY